ncbi:phosphotransferase family protein [Aeromicrobium tamlense]|uniref:Aminoglycoside phosphotransferase (APT) family kinase protein n=1 Tax=Aeromicrobium tamlense TaxID=375541 RepID=A0A8I0KJD1_9ACTN|nr:phosphotransferase family protein [Aeromicrobium tamlense]MBD1271865.1 phosphotransferase family protein [Aeromicrobium tamlense]NYI38946.1 aminoglycoside phosphotransferase (APT) family kinase protein [Aeromicrobium tamlense]
MTAPDVVKGLDLEALRTWLDAEAPGELPGALSASLITGGKSNLTYAVTNGERDVIVRRPPLGHVLATAHDMGREHRVMAALAGTSVPVPRMIAECTDESVIGATFYVMERMSGTAFQRASDLEVIGAERTRAVTERLVDTLADLHAVDYQAVGLGDFGRPDGYLTRQVARWKKQLDSSRSREIDGIDELADRLTASVPETGESTIVHGDYRLDNVLVDTEDGDRITTVLDWEMSTLGDPLTDVAVMLAYQHLALDAGPSSGQVTDAPQAPGYLSPDESVERYAKRSGRDVSELGFHLGLAYFKLAVILEGIHFRHSAGQTVGSGFDGIGAMIDPLVQHGLAATSK